jgi:hypothetical protein
VLPIEGERTIDRLIREGRVTSAQQRKRSLPTPLKAKVAVSELITEQPR